MCIPHRQTLENEQNQRPHSDMSVLQSTRFRFFILTADVQSIVVFGDCILVSFRRTRPCVMSEDLVHEDRSHVGIERGDAFHVVCNALDLPVDVLRVGEKVSNLAKGFLLIVRAEIVDHHVRPIGQLA